MNSRSLFVGGLLLVVAMMVPGSGYAQEQQALLSQKDISGIYKCQGVGPDGTYQGIVEISKYGGTYRLHWILDDDEDLGLGILNGDTLAVSFVESRSVRGVMLFRIEMAGRLVGGWTLVGANGQVYSETLIKLSEEEVTKLPPRQPQSAPSPARPIKVA